MTTTPSRTFTLLDGMILVAASAVAIASSREIGIGGVFDGWSKQDWSGRMDAVLQTGVDVLIPSLPVITPALLVLRLRRPRPPLRRLLLQPGAVACAVAAVGMVVGVLDGSVEYAVNAINAGTPSVPHRNLIGLVDASLRPVAFAVPVCWGLLATSRLCRPEPSWIDRTGRVVGILWVVLALAFWGLGIVNIVRPRPIGGFGMP